MEGKKIIIGNSAFTSKKPTELSPEEIAKIQNNKDFYKVTENAQEKFTDTLESNNYAFVPELPNGIKYPTVNEWINSLSLDSFHLRFYPCFIKDKQTGDLLFCKAKIASAMDAQGGEGLAYEAKILSHLPSDIASPRLIKYVSEGENGPNQLELLVIEAIKYSEAHAVPVSDWKPKHVENVLKQIEQIEKIPIESVPKIPKEPVVNVYELWKKAKNHLNENFSLQAESILQNPESDASPVFTHGDMWLKNVLVGANLSDSKTLIVDWTRGGAGYRGEDIARFWWDLWSNESLRNTVPNLYLKDDGNENKESRKKSLKFGIIFAALRDINDYIFDLQKKPDNEWHQSLLGKIQAIQEKSLAMISLVS